MPRVSRGQLDVLVVGAGVCGLTCAVCLAEAGLNVQIRAAAMPPETTSAVAGAIWGPHLVEESDRVTRWAAVTLDVLAGLAGAAGAGVALTRGVLAWRRPAEPPPWTGELPGLRQRGPADLPPGYAAGWQYTAPVLDMPVYLGYLLDRFGAAGGDARVASVGSLEQAAAEVPVVVNCAGIGAHDLVPDPALRPVRGQAVVVANPGITEFFISPADGGAELAYMFPHGKTVLLGGTEQEGDWNTGPDPADTARILADCAAIEPRLAGAAVLAERIGLRPVRPQVRLEAEPAGAGRVIVHNYGHGGAGVTLSWGCAREIAGLLLR